MSSNIGINSRFSSVLFALLVLPQISFAWSHPELKAPPKSINEPEDAVKWLAEKGKMEILESRIFSAGNYEVFVLWYQVPTSNLLAQYAYTYIKISDRWFLGDIWNPGFPARLKEVRLGEKKKAIEYVHASGAVKTLTVCEILRSARHLA